MTDLSELKGSVNTLEEAVYELISDHRALMKENKKLKAEIKKLKRRKKK
jgi:regulator of replication initiation timing